MSVWLTPDLKPIVGGTYFPPDNRFGRPGLKDILMNLANKVHTETGTHTHTHNMFGCDTHPQTITIMSCVM